MTSIHDMTAVELLAAYKTKKLSPLEAVDAVIARIEAWEPRLKALYAPDFAGARRLAGESAKRWAAGKPIGSLDGVPRSRSRKTSPPRGVRAARRQRPTELVPAAADAPAAARVREAGAILLAKTTMPDYGMLSSGRSLHFHPLTSAIPGTLALGSAGSSAGAGAAGSGRLRPLHPRHRHRRLGAAAGVLERHLHPETQPRPRAGRSALSRPRDRADDADGSRLGAADGRTLQARCARPHEPAAGRHRLVGGDRLQPKGLQDRSLSRRGLGPAGRSGSDGSGRGRGQAVREGRRARRAAGAVPAARDAAPAGFVLAGAELGRFLGIESRQSRPACCRSSPTGAAAAPTSRAPR